MTRSASQRKRSVESISRGALAPVFAKKPDAIAFRLIQRFTPGRSNRVLATQATLQRQHGEFT